MTAQEVFSKTQKDPIFALGFSVDNNPTGVISAIQSAGYSGVSDKKTAMALLTSLLESGQRDKVIKIISPVPYVNDSYTDGVLNYTSGLKTFFLANTPPELYNPNAKLALNWSGLLAALGIGISTYAAAGMGGGTKTPEQIAAEKEEEKRKEEEKKKKNEKTWMIIGITAGVIVLGLVIFAIYKGTTTKEDKK